MRETAHWAGLNRPQYPSTFESPSETRDSRRGGNAAAESVWFPGSEQKRPVCDLVEETIEGDMRNRQHAIRLKGLAGRKRHADVVTNTGYEIPLVGTWLDLTVRVADVDGGGAVERDRGCLCLKKILYQPFLCRRPTDMEHDSRAGRDGAFAGLVFVVRTRKDFDDDSLQPCVTPCAPEENPAHSVNCDGLSFAQGAAPRREVDMPQLPTRGQAGSKQLGGHHVLSPPSLRRDLGYLPRHVVTAAYPGWSAVLMSECRVQGCSCRAGGLFVSRIG